MDDKKTGFREQAAQNFIEGLQKKSSLTRQLKAGTSLPPVSLATGSAYSGINRVVLSGAGQVDPRWMTKKQVEERGYQISESAKPQQLVFWDTSGDRPAMRHYSVYNAADLSTADSQKLPPPERSVQEHQLTGEPGALVKQALEREQGESRYPARTMTTEDASRDKLKIHLATMMVAQDLGVKFDPKLDTLTVKNWREQLGKNPEMLFQAAKQAEKLRGLALDPEKAVERVAEPDPSPATAGLKPEITQDRVILQVPYAEKDQAKAAGAKWDRENKFWVAEAGADLSKLTQWLPEDEPEASPNLAPEDEFAQALASAGFKLDGPPIMNGSMQRAPVDGGNPNAQDGVYQARLDGDQPNGWLKNHRSGQYQAWMYSGQTLSTEKKSEMRQTQAEERRAALEKAEKRVYARWVNGIDVAQEFSNQIDGLVPTSELLKNPYLEVAGVNPFGVRRDDDGNLMIPAVSPDGRLKNIQTISPIGEATFEKGCRREGVMCLIDSDQDISEAGQHGFPHLKKEADNNPGRSILIAEDYATGASIHMATGKPVAVAFYPGNLVNVAKTMRDRFPEANLVICANNAPGRYHNNSYKLAVEAANETKAHLICPNFSPTDQEQGLISFNDLHKCYGLEAVEKDMAPALAKAAEQKNDQGRGR